MKGAKLLGRPTTTTTPRSSSWENVNHWYDKLVGKEGHYFHQHLIIPGTQRLLGLENSIAKKKNTLAPSFLDIGCGQGVLGRKLPRGIDYVGVDVSRTLIKKARQYDTDPKHCYLVADATQPYLDELKKRTKRAEFSHAAFVLSLQNMKDQANALVLAAECLNDHGALVIVLNHPCFRVPRQSRWEVDQQNNTQYRRIDRYHSALEVPIVTHPGNHSDSPAGESSESDTTYSYHHPLEQYFRWLHKAGMVVESLEEWYSDKASAGGQAKRENRARSEFPLFLAISSFKFRKREE